MQVKVGYVQRDLCYPSSDHWNRIMGIFQRFTDHFGTEKLLVSLSMGKVDPCPFQPADIVGFKNELIEATVHSGFHLRKAGDRIDLPIDYRFLHMLLLMADDPEVGLGAFSREVRVGPSTRMPRLPAPKRRWRLASQQDKLDYLEQTVDPGGIWRRN